MYNLIIIYKKGTDLFSHIEYFDETARNIFFKSGNTCIFNSTILSLFISDDRYCLLSFLKITDFMIT